MVNSQLEQKLTIKEKLLSNN